MKHATVSNDILLESYKVTLEPFIDPEEDFLLDYKTACSIENGEGCEACQ